MMSKPEFDALGQLYDETFTLPWRRYLEVPTVLRLLGDLTGRSVLDLGSGSGWHCAKLVRLGAREVVGLEVSSGMVDYAGKHHSHPRIEYLLGDIPAQLHGHFDTVISVCVFGYASTRDQLDGLFRTAATALRPGGRFLAIGLHPDHHGDPDYYAPYGFRIHPAGSRSDGTQVTLEIRFGEHDAALGVTYWSHDALAAALRSAGFLDITRPCHHLDEHGRRELGSEFWRDYLACPHAVILDCRLRHRSDQCP